MSFGGPRALLGAIAFAAFALTRCGADSSKTDDSSDDGAATGGLAGESGSGANGGSNQGGTDTGGSGTGGSTGGEAGANAGGTGAVGGQGGTAGTSGGTDGASGSPMSGGSGGTPMMGGRGGGGRGGTAGTNVGGGTGGSVSGAAGAGGSNAWMPCPNPRMPAMLGGSGNSDSFATTEAVCYRVTDTFNAWGCRNLGNRTVRVNGVAVTCSESLGTWPLPDRVDGAYYFEFSAGAPDNTSFYWYRV